MSSPSTPRVADDVGRSPGRPRIGCSGWHYKQWRGPVYPESLAPSKWLRAYTSRFDAVEVNNTFYRLPLEDTFAEWRSQVPSSFRFAVKASRFLTHIKRLRDPEEPLARLFDRLRPLGVTIGPVLFQLPPRWQPDLERFEYFLRALPRRMGRVSLHHVIEMRDSRLYSEAMLSRLTAHQVSLCLHDMPGSESPFETESPLFYVRFHGYGAKYAGSYPNRILDQWAERIARAVAVGRPAYAFFNNDIGGTAVRDAERLRERVFEQLAS